MSLPLRLLLSVSLSIFGWEARAYCDPAVDYSIKGEFARSIYVGVVRAESVTWLDDDRKPVPLSGPLGLGSIPGGLDPYAGAKYGVRSLEVFKGRLPRRFTIFSENSTARTPLKLGRTYLVFLLRQTETDWLARAGDLVIDNCGNYDAADTAGRKIGELRLLARR